MHLSIYLIFSNSTFSQDSLITETGFILYNVTTTLKFVPVKVMDINNPLNSLLSDKHGVAFYFNHTSYNGTLEWNRTKRFETLGCELLPISDTADRVTKIIPVRLSYKIYFFDRSNDDYKKLLNDGDLLLINNKKRLIKYKTDQGKNVKIKKIEYLNW